MDYGPIIKKRARKLNFPKTVRFDRKNLEILFSPECKRLREKLKVSVEKIDRLLNWYVKRGGLLPYDWNTYFNPLWEELKKEIE